MKVIAVFVLAVVFVALVIIDMWSKSKSSED